MGEDEVEVVLGVAVFFLEVSPELCHVFFVFELLFFCVNAKPLVFCSEELQLLLMLFVVFCVFVFEGVELGLVLGEGVFELAVVELLAEGLVLAVGDDDGFVELLVLELLLPLLLHLCSQQLYLLQQHRAFPLELLLAQLQLNHNSSTCLFSRKIYFY